jgi:hypothetical protein
MLIAAAMMARRVTHGCTSGMSAGRTLIVPDVSNRAG